MSTYIVVSYCIDRLQEFFSYISKYLIGYLNLWTLLWTVIQLDMFTTTILFQYLLSCTQHPLDLALTPESGAMNVLHWFQSPDMKNWTYNGPVAWGVTSLGAHQENEFLAITCIQEVRPPTWIEQQFPRVYGYLFDGTSFTPTDWSIDDAETKSYIDPQWYDGKMWYISPTGYTGDPANAPNTPIRSEGTTVYSAPRISDPSPVLFEGTTHLFATKNGSLIHLSGDPLRPLLDPEEVKHFNGTTVPFAFVDNNQLYLVAQRQFNGRRTPMISRYTSAKKWTGWQPIVTLPPSIQACTSPVVAESPAGGWVMMCIEEKRR